MKLSPKAHKIRMVVSILSMNKAIFALLLVILWSSSFGFSANSQAQTLINPNNGLSHEPNAVIDWSVLRDILPESKLPSSLPEAPEQATRSALNLNLLNQDQVPQPRSSEIGAKEQLLLPQIQRQKEAGTYQEPEVENQNNAPLMANAPPALPSDLQTELSNPEPNLMNSEAGLDNNSNNNNIVESPVNNPSENIVNSAQKPLNLPPPSPEQLVAPKLAEALESPKKTDLAMLPPSVESPKPEAIKPENNQKPKPSAIIGNESLLLRIHYRPLEVDYKAKDKVDLEAVIDHLKEQTDIKIDLVSFAHDPTSTRLDQSMMRRLSLTRARNVREYLIDQGIDQTRIFLKPMGDMVDQSGLQSQTSGLQSALTGLDPQNDMTNRLDINLAQ